MTVSEVPAIVPAALVGARWHRRSARERHAVAVEHSLEVARGRGAKPRIVEPPRFARKAAVNSSAVLGLVAQPRGVAAVVADLFGEPREHSLGVIWLSAPR